MMNSTIMTQIEEYLCKSFYVPPKIMAPRVTFQKLGFSQTEFWEVVAEVEIIY